LASGKDVDGGEFVTGTHEHVVVLIQNSKFNIQKKSVSAIADLVEMRMPLTYDSVISHNASNAGTIRMSIKKDRKNVEAIGCLENCIRITMIRLIPSNAK
jgi:hypothetical protein